MKDYKQLLKELPSSTIVCAMGEFDPPTVGHEMLVKTVKRLAEEKNSAHVIFTKSGVLQEDKKEQYLSLMFPKTNFKSLEETFAGAVVELKKKYKNVIVVAGSDQMPSMKRGLKESVQFIPITEKDPDADENKMKSFATRALFEEFKKKLPTSIRELDGKRLMNDVRQGMGLEPIKEQLNLVKDELREQYFRGEIFNVGDLVESNGQQYEIVKRGSNHLLLKEESGKLVSKWIQDVTLIEGVIQPNGTDQVKTVEPNKVDPKDQNGNPMPRDKGNKKGFLTFYGYTKDQNDFKVAKMESVDIEACLAGEQDPLTQNPTEVGHSMVHAHDFKGKHHLRRQKVNYAFKEAKEKDSKKVLPHDKEVAHLKGDESRGGNCSCSGGSGENTIALRQEAYKKKSAYEKINNRFKTLTGRSLEDASKEWEKRSKEAEERLKQYQQERGIKNEEIEIPKDAPSVEDIAKKHGVTVDHINKQLEIGMKVEAEHGKNPGSEREIALDHLNEKPDYYTRLKKFVEGLEDACWKGYTAVGMKKKNGKKVPNCVPVTETKLNPLDPHGDYQAKRKALQDIQMDPATYKDPELRAELIRSKAALEKEYEPHRIKEKAEELDETKRMSPQVKLQRAWEREQAKSDASRRRAANAFEKSPKAQEPTGSPQSQKPFDPFFKEDEDFNIEELVESITDEDIMDLYEEEELSLIYEDTGEEVPVCEEEAQIDLMEVLSRPERMKAKFRFRRSKAKRERSTKIALKRFSPVKTINARARRLAIKLLKQRMLRGRNYQDVSIGDKERVDQAISKRKAVIDRIAAKLVARIRRTEKSRMSHGTFTKGEEPKVF